MALVRTRPTTTPVKTTKTPGLTPYQTLVRQAQTPVSGLPGGISPTQLMSGLTKTDWNQQALSALAPAYRAGLGSLQFGYGTSLANAGAQAAALQGAYTAAGGQLPRVGSEFTSLGSAMADLGKALAPGTVPQTGAASLAAAGAPGFVAGSVPTDTSAAQSYI